MEKSKCCSKCKTPKPLNEFHKRNGSKDGYDHHCKECGNLRHREKYKNDNEYKERMKRKNIKYLHKLSEDNLNELYKAINCQICNVSLNNKKKCIDHNHITNNIRGILCSKCNNLLGACNDNINILESAIFYLKKSG